MKKIVAILLISLFFTSSAFAGALIKTVPQFKWGLKLSTVMPCAKTMEGVCTNVGAAEKFSCLMKVMFQFKQCKQNIAFMQATNGIILDVKTYMDKNLYVVKTKVFNADKRAVHFYIINKYGELIALVKGVTLIHSPNYSLIKAKYPAVKVWQLAGRFPTIRTLDTGNSQLIFNQALKDGCISCASIGTAKMGYTFDKTGKLVSVKIIKLIPRTKSL